MILKNLKKKLLPGIVDAKVSGLDRWKILITPDSSEDPIVDKVVNNYFSIGIDAKVALKFHEKREKNPEMFSSRAGNKLWYAKFGLDSAFKGCPNLHQQMEVTIDEELVDLPSCEALIIANIPSCYGGAFLWKKDPPMLVEDGFFEIVCVSNGAHLGQVLAGGNPVFLKQGKDIVIKFNKTTPCQIDGEPWKQHPGTIHIHFHNKVKMMVKYKEAHDVVKTTAYNNEE